MIAVMSEPTMTPRARVLAALGGGPVDRVPLAFWLHNFATENSAEGLAEETCRLHATFGWDFLKPQSRAQCFAEMWGLRYAPSSERATPYAVTRAPLTTADDVAGLRPVDAGTGALGEQLQALRMIRARLGGEIPIIWTVFSPLMVLPFLMAGGRAQVLALLRSDAAAVERGLGAISETLVAYARAAVAAGADGLFYATNLATRALLAPAECRRFQRPFDLPVLEAAGAAPFNLVHVCGDDVHFDEFADYPVHAFSWALGPGNPSLAEGARRTGRAVVGGLPAKPQIASMTTDQLVGRALRAVDEMAERALLLGPDCSINPDTPESLLHAVGAAVRRGRPRASPA
jgi:uroporphyrinogen decarboxylase